MATAYSLGEIAGLVQGAVEGDPTLRVLGVLPFDAAGPEYITCAASAAFLNRFEQTRAGAVIVGRAARCTGKPLVRVDNPKLAFAKVIALFHPPARPFLGIHPKACTGEGFSCGTDPSIGPGVVIGSHVTVGDRVTLYPNVVLGDNVTLGDDVCVYPNVSILERCRIGNRVTIHASTVIGSDGFGFAPDGEHYHKIPQTGIVQIEDDVEIGAGNTIDRAAFGKTWIRRGVKTDNLVHVAHNVEVGEDTVLVAQVGIAGSVTIGRHAILAGQAGIAEHLSIGDFAIVGPQAGLAKSVAGGQVVSGSPAIDHKLWLRAARVFAMLPQMLKRLSVLEDRLARLEEAKQNGNGSGYPQDS